MGVLDVLRGGASVAAGGFHGYAEDQENRVAQALRAKQEARQAENDRVLNAFRMKPEPTPLTTVAGPDGRPVRGPDVAGAEVYVPPVPDRLTTGLGPDGKPTRVVDAPGVKVPEPAGPRPERPNLITAPNPITGVPERVEDRAGVQVPEVSSTSGAAKIRAQLASNKTQLDVINDAMKELDAYPDAVGAKRSLGDLVPALGGVSDYVNQRVDPKGVSARAQIANVGSLVIHDRSGAAVTVSEFPRLAPFVPRQGDTPQVIRDKLAKLRQNLETETNLLEKGMVSTPAGGTQPTAGKPAGTTPSPLGSRAAAEAHLKGQGKTSQQILQILGPP